MEPSGIEDLLYFFPFFSFCFSGMNERFSIVFNTNTTLLTTNNIQNDDEEEEVEEA